MIDIENTLSGLCPVRGRTPLDRLDALSETLDAWQRADSPIRLASHAALVSVGAFGDAMICVGLDVQAARIAPTAIRTMLADAHPRLRGRHPRKSAIVQAGNIPGLSLADLVLSAVAGDVVALKMPADDPVTGAALAEALPCAAAFRWRGGEREDGALLDWCEHVLAYGADDTVASIAREADRRGLAHETFGHRVSVAWVHEDDVDDPELSRRLAFDMSMWDQEGCLSPHVVFVSGDAPVAPLVDGLAASLQVLHDVLPPAARSFDRKAAVRAFLSRAEAASLTNANVTIRMGPGVGWLVVATDHGPLSPSPLGRAITVRRVPDVDSFFDAIAPWAGRIQAVGASRMPADEGAWVRALDRLGATRLCRLGRLQEPGPAWVGEERGGGEGRVALEPESEGAWRRVTRA